ncbi:MAG: glycerol-3-phosphate dehydrogenase/oxidase [Pseudomonadota bacterium]
MNRQFSSLRNRSFDLLVCGGGIYGAWTAYDAALRGLTVAIVEQGDWGSATSSASSKLIHGGLRYLETHDFKLVSKSLKERQMLQRVAPHRVWPLRFGVPLYSRQRIGRWKLKLGLTLYDFMAGDISPTLRHRYFNRTQFAAHFPFLNEKALTGGFTYADAQTDDARLVLELIAGAMEAGAVCVNYCKLANLQEINEQAYRAVIQDQLTRIEQKIAARQIVFTTGQWLTDIEQNRSECRLAKGAHLIMPAVLADEALLLTAKSDGRVFFVIPWYGLTLLGTTDTDYTGDLDRVTVDEADVSYLLAAVNDYLKTPWTAADIIGRFAGVRVLRRPDRLASTDSPSAVSRDWALKSTRHGVHYSVGGKITSARQDAAHIVDTVCAQLGLDAACATQDRIFPWAPQESFVEWSLAAQAQAIRLGIDADSAKWLIRRHGKQVDAIFRSIEATPESVQRIIPSLPFIDADLLHCARTEMVVHLDDLLRRRLPLLILTNLTRNDLQHITTRIATTMNWDEADISQEVDMCQKRWSLQ